MYSKELTPHRTIEPLGPDNPDSEDGLLASGKAW